MKYVAFLDILGFKDKLKTLSQQQAADFIGCFSTTAFHQWEQEEISKLNGYIVSDSFIIYSNDATIESLTEIIRVVTNICKQEFSKNSILIRGAIAKGEFEKLEAKEISTLQKGLIVGQAYVDAYLLESSFKSTGIILSSDVYEDICNVGGYSDDLFKETIEKKEHYFLRYLNINFILNQNNLHSFTKMAIESKWLPIYYNTLYFALKRENNEKKVYQIFINLLEIISNDRQNENWRDIDLFIKNAFHPDVINDFQTRFLKFIRQKIQNKNI